VLYHHSEVHAMTEEEHALNTQVEYWRNRARERADKIKELEESLAEMTQKHGKLAPQEMYCKICGQIDESYTAYCSKCGRSPHGIRDKL